MTTQIQRRRGTTTEHGSFTGAVGEITIDTTKDTVIVHDGSTAGGHPLAKENNPSFTGNVGIGTSSASSYSSYASNLVVHEAGNAGISISSTDSSSNVSSIQFTGGTTRRHYIECTNGSNGNFTFQTGGTGSFRFIDGTGERLRIDSSGKVGIGTTSPQSSLSVAGSIPNAPSTEGVHLGLDSNYASMQLSGNTGGVIDFSEPGVDTAGRIIYTHSTDEMQFSTAASTKMTINSSGNVGIGTTSPGAKLQIETNAADAAKLRIAFDSTRYYDIFRGSVTNSGFLNFYGSQSGFTGYVFGGVDGERMRIDSSGRVGIGTSTLYYKLNVEGDSYFNGDITLSSNPKIQTDSSGGSLQLQGGNTYPGGNILLGGGSSTDDIRFRTTGVSTTSTERMRIDNSGRLLVGTTTVQAHANMDDLQLGDGTGNRGLTISSGTSAYGSVAFGDSTDGAGTDRYSGYIEYYHGDNSMRFATIATERMRIDDSGNVFIGGSTAASADIALNANGSISAAGGNGISDNQSFGISEFGRVSIREDASSPVDVFTVYKGAANKTIQLNNDGSITAAGNVKVGDANATASTAGGVLIGYTGYVTAVRPASSTGTVFNAYQGATQKVNINAAGTATFAGTVSAQGSVLTSDQRFKENITDASSQLADVIALGNKLRNWDWTDDAPIADKDARFLGLVAQEAETISPGIVATIARTKDGDELTPEVVVPAVYETRTVPAVLDEEGEVVEAETTEQVLVTEEQVTPATYEQLDDSYKGIKNDVLVMKLLGAVAELSAKVAALEAAN